jgi:hypothetical protein
MTINISIIVDSKVLCDLRLDNKKRSLFLEIFI